MKVIYRIALTLQTLLVVGCAGTPAPPVQTYEGPPLPDHQLATLIDREVRSSVTAIDGAAYDWPNFKNTYKLLPGKHRLTYRVRLYKGAYADAQLIVKLSAGTLYTINTKSGGFRESYDTVMVSDESANRVIAEQTIYDADRTLYTTAFPLHPPDTVLTKDDELMDRAVSGSSEARMLLYKLVRDGNPEFSAWRKFPFRKPYSGFWFLCRAADNGYAEARYELGRLYEIGDDQVPRDLVKALMWYRLSTKGGHDWALKDIARLSQAATPSQLEQLESMLSNWKPRACEEELYESKRKTDQKL